MTKVIDLMELYRILNDSDDEELLLKDMMEAASLDARIDRDVLADTIVSECGTMYPRWNTTTIFKRFGINFFRRASREIRRDLDALELEYDPLMEYEESRNELVDEDIADDHTRTDNLTELRTDDLQSARTDNLSELRTDNLQSARTDNLTELRTPNITETVTAGAGAQTDRYVSADNESELVIRSRDVSTIPGESSATTGSETTTNTGTQNTTNTGTQTTANTGTQTTANTGTQTTANTGTQRNQRDYGRDLSRDTEITGRKRTGADLIREEILANHFNIYDIIVRKFADQMLMGVY